ncbi:PAS domain-containing sensor histidine kinase [Fulvivirgaceae bacterium PWU20]|uniref:histidine kinase n=1 Tax=Chryseosolibacter indicus TaxID=2782351 RepID=A0ABS5VMA9_9BACT|nr:PAS domain-containing sensor histidine kinase [Chryseosolibacter indicus]
MTKSSIPEVISAIGALAKDGYFLYNVKKNTLDYTNSSLLKIFDISHTSFSSQPAFFINHILSEDLEHLQAEYSLFSRLNKVEDVLFRIKQHDGTFRYLQLNAYKYNNEYVVGIIKDVTELKEREEYVINYGAKKNSLLDMVTHNLAGPLHLSRNIIESIERNRISKVSDIQAQLELIKENTNHCIDIVNDFLEEEHLVSEHISVKANPFNVIEKLEIIIERIRKSYPDYSFKINTKQKDITIQADDVKFLQVANNLISNAVKFSPTKSTIEIAITESPKTVIIAFKDSGIGIPDSMKSALFQKNTPASRPGLMGEKSIGMGLYIVKKLVQLMNGQVDFESKENVGTTFTLTFPKDDIEHAS